METVPPLTLPASQSWMNQPKVTATSTVAMNLKAGEKAGPCSGWPSGSSKRKGGGPSASMRPWFTSSGR